MTVSQENGKLNELENEIKRLSKLSELECELERQSVADKYNIRLPVIDKHIEEEKNKCNVNDDGSVLFPKIKPWHEPVDAASLLDGLEEILNRLMAFPSKHEVKAVALHIIHTHCIDAAYCSPILNITSPEKRCGKSTLMSVLARLNHRALIASNISDAAVYRSIEKWQPTLMIDEADTFFSEREELRGVINSGHTRDSAFVVRCVGDNHEPERFNTWCPKVIAGIGHLPDTTEDRSIIIQLRRKLIDEKKDKLRDVPALLFDNLLQKCVRFAMDNIERLKKIKPSVLGALNDRAADSWTPLLAIAELAGRDWIEDASDAAIYLSGTKQEPISIGVELLQDIQEIFNGKYKDANAVTTEELIDALCSDADAPWATYNFKKQDTKIVARQLSKLLSSYGIRPVNNIGVKNQKGYIKDHFKKAFVYIPSDIADFAAPSARPCSDADSRENEKKITSALCAISAINNEAEELIERVEPINCKSEKTSEPMPVMALADRADELGHSETCSNDYVEI